MNRRDRAVLVPALAACTLFKLVLLSYPIAAVLTATSTGAQIGGGLALLIVIGAQPVITVAVLTGRRHDRLPATLAVAELVGSLPPLFVLGELWSALPTLGIADVLLCVSGWPRVALTGTAVVAYVVGAATWVHGVDLLEELGQAGLSVTIFFAVLRMATFIRELAEARVELARLAVGQERLRMARDLHDTLGHTLTVGLFKVEVARRMTDIDPRRVRRELDEVSEVLHESMHAVQEVVAGARDTSLHGEISRALSVLRSAGIEARVAVEDRELRRDVEETLGWIVREGTTNVLRHSSASACSIELSGRADGAVVLTILNDSPSPPGHRWAPSGGHGLVGIRQRLATIGGELTVHSDETSYRMMASVPEEGA